MDFIIENNWSSCEQRDKCGPTIIQIDVHFTESSCSWGAKANEVEARVSRTWRETTIRFYARDSKHPSFLRSTFLSLLFYEYKDHTANLHEIIFIPSPNTSFILETYISDGNILNQRNKIMTQIVDFISDVFLDTDFNDHLRIHSKAAFAITKSKVFLLINNINISNYVDCTRKKF